MHGWFQVKPSWRADAPGGDSAGAGAPGPDVSSVAASGASASGASASGVGASGARVSGARHPGRDSRALIDLAGGTCARVERIDSGYRLLNRLLALGIAPGVQLRVLRNPRRGPLLVLVHDTRVALGRGEAAKLRLVPKSSREGAADAAE